MNIRKATMAIGVMIICIAVLSVCCYGWGGGDDREEKKEMSDLMMGVLNEINNHERYVVKGNIQVNVREDIKRMDGWRIIPAKYSKLFGVVDSIFDIKGDEEIKLCVQKNMTEDYTNIQVNVGEKEFKVLENKGYEYFDAATLFRGAEYSMPAGYDYVKFDKTKGREMWYLINIPEIARNKILFNNVYVKKNGNETLYRADLNMKLLMGDMIPEDLCGQLEVTHSEINAQINYKVYLGDRLKITTKYNYKYGEIFPQKVPEEDRVLDSSDNKEIIENESEHSDFVLTGNIKNRIKLGKTGITKFREIEKTDYLTKYKVEFEDSENVLGDIDEEIGFRHHLEECIRLMESGMLLSGFGGEEEYTITENTYALVSWIKESDTALRHISFYISDTNYRRLTYDITMRYEDIDKGLEYAVEEIYGFTGVRVYKDELSEYINGTLERMEEKNTYLVQLEDGRHVLKIYIENKGQNNGITVKVKAMETDLPDIS